MTFTVLTATFNRRDKLHRVYESLQNQSFRDFEWLIVDDGSSDGTEALVRSWAEKADFKIRYLYKENGGKHTALNLGIPLGTGKYTVIFDSDDSCVATALEEFKDAWAAIPDPAYFACVTCLCQDEAGRIIGTEFPAPIWDSDHLTAVYIHKMKGDKWECWRTEILRAFPFPEPPNTKLIPESVVLNLVARKYRTRYLNKPLRVYHNDGLDSSLVRTADPKKYASGYRFCELALLNGYMDYFSRAPSYFAVSIIKYVRACLYLGIKLSDQLKDLKGPAKMLWVFGLVPGVLIVCWERSRGQNISGKIRVRG